MNSPLQLAWAVPKSDDLDVKDFALQLLESAKENLQRDGELVSVAFVITPDQLQCYSMKFGDQEGKTSAYHDLVKAAQTANASAVITLNDAYWRNKADAQYLEGYYPGKLAADGAEECIMVTVSGPSLEMWCIRAPYRKSEEGIKFGAHAESFGNEIGFLEGWAEGKPRIN
jgi:hypothetical protein